MNNEDELLISLKYNFPTRLAWFTEGNRFIRTLPVEFLKQYTYVDKALGDRRIDDVYFIKYAVRDTLLAELIAYEKNMSV